MSKLRWLWLGWILALALMSGAAAEARGQDSSRKHEIDELLAARSASVAAGDRDGFLRSVDPGAGVFLAAQQAWFDQLRPVPIDGYRLELDLEEAPEFTRERDRKKYGREAIVALVEERFRIKDFDEHPVTNSLFYTFVKKADGWRIASDSDLEDLGIFSSRQPWDFGPVSISRSPHFLLVVHPSDSNRAGSLLSAAESALPQVRRVWRGPWSERVPIYVPASENELARLLDATFDVRNFVAVAVSSVDLDEGWHPVSRVIVNPQNFLRRTAAVQTTILTHELVHVATRQASGPHLMNMVEEGLAQYAESERPAPMSKLNDDLRRAGFDGVLPEDSDFFTGGGVAIRRSYLEALSAITYFVDRYGIDRLGQFYSALGSARIEPGIAAYHLDQALRSVAGISFADFEREWAEAVRSG